MNLFGMKVFSFTNSPGQTVTVQATLATLQYNPIGDSNPSLSRSQSVRDPTKRDEQNRESYVQ